MTSTYQKIMEAMEQEEVVASDKEMGAVTVCLADVQPEEVKWLWPKRIPLGKLTLIAGDPGLGKSLTTAYLAATVSQGYVWPLEDSPCPIGSVVLLSAEDGAADTIRPRLDAAGADCTRIHVLQAIREIGSDGKPVERTFSLKRDIVALEKLIPTLRDCRLLVIDPISAYLDDTDSHKNSDVRGLLAPLAKLAADYGIAIVMVQHFNKNSGGNALYRAIGSIAFTAAARVTYNVTKDKNDPERRLFLPAKNNLAKANTGLAYSVIETENGAPVIAWELEPVEMTADEALEPSETNERKTAVDWAAEFLEDALSNGSLTSNQLHKQARLAGVSKNSLEKAQARLGIKPRKTGYDGGWAWSLPGHESTEEYEEPPFGNEGVLGVFDEKPPIQGVIDDLTAHNAA